MGPVQGQVWVKCGPQLGSSVQEYIGSIVGRLQGGVRVGIGVGWRRIGVHNPGRDGVGGRSGTGRQQREIGESRAQRLTRDGTRQHRV